jgi:serine/threonine-protein kinase
MHFVFSGGREMQVTGDYARGDVLAGRYRVDHVIGKGGMGCVVAALDLRLHRRVAIKLMLPALAGDADSVARFMREAEACVALSSEHSVRVHDVGRLEQGTPFMVMEHLAGADLGQVLAERGRLPPREAVALLLQAAEGIAEAHAAGIVHRDLKPRNLFLTRDTRGEILVKVLDFGLAKTALVPGQRGLTTTSAVMGSPEYMSPEQLRGSRDVDVRSDIWSLGVCLYELVTGECPFTAPNVPDLLVRILHTDPKPPHTLVLDVPFALSQVIVRCLAKDPAKRFADIAELATELAPFGALDDLDASWRIEKVLHTTRRHVRAPQPVLDVAGPDTATTAALDARPTAIARRRVFWGLAGAAAFAGALALSLGMSRPRAPSVRLAAPVIAVTAVAEVASAPETTDLDLAAPPRVGVSTVDPPEPVQPDAGHPATKLAPAPKPKAAVAPPPTAPASANALPPELRYP